MMYRIDEIHDISDIAAIGVLVCATSSSAPISMVYLRSHDISYRSHAKSSSSLNGQFRSSYGARQVQVLRHLLGDSIWAHFMVHMLGQVVGTKIVKLQ